MNFQSLTIKITDISDGKGEAFKAVIPEYGNSIILADTLSEIFELVPEVLKEAKKYKFGPYKKGLASEKSSVVKKKKLAKV
jgi:hypothetical protein